MLVKPEKRETEVLKDRDRDLRLGPLKMKAPVDTNSRLGIEPAKDPELALERPVDEVGTAEEFVGDSSSTGVVLNRELSTLWNVTRRLACLFSDRGMLFLSGCLAARAATFCIKGMGMLRGRGNA